MANATETKGGATRAAILERAVDLASVEGLEGLTIGRLASDLGMSKSGLFAHFGSKQDLQLATVAAAARALPRPCDRRPRSTLPTARRACGRWPTRYFDHLDGLLRRLLLGRRPRAEYDDRPGPVRDAIAAALDAWMAELVRQAEAAGIADPERYAFELYAVVMGANSRFRLSGDRGVFDLARAALARLEAELP